MGPVQVPPYPRSLAAPLVKPFHEPGVAGSVIRLGTVTSVVWLVTPRGRGAVREQIEEALATLHTALQRQPAPQSVTTQTIFLRNASDQALCERMLAEACGGPPPVTTFVCQPPAGDAALAIEAWSVGGESVRLERLAPQVLVAGYDGLTWVYCGGVTPRPTGDVYEQSCDALQQTNSLLTVATVGFERVVRTWFYLSDITGPVGPWERYMELNRARTDVYRDIPFGGGQPRHDARRTVYPASTGVGMRGSGLTMQCLALDTRRADVFLQPLENPDQTPSYRYPPVYSPDSPKFTRAMAIVSDEAVTIWISGTASILDSETHHPSDPRRQIEQSIHNLERLIAPENFARHGLAGDGASLPDLAHVHVYLKRPTDYPLCRELCERRFGTVPILYTLADVCRADLLVEMEGVAFAPRRT